MTAPASRPRGLHKCRPRAPARLKLNSRHGVTGMADGLSKARVCPRIPGQPHVPQRWRCQHLLSLLLQLLGLHALLYFRQEGRAGGCRALQTPLLSELLHLHLQLSVGEPYLLELQLALMQLSERQQTVVRRAEPKQKN